jgi:hypothetical protein
MAIPSNRGHTSILVMRDAGSRYTWFAPMHDDTALTVAKQLSSWFCAGGAGVPRQLTADDEFYALIIEEICTQLRRQRHIVTPYHHSGNGVVERVIDQAHQQFRVSEAGDDWDLFIDSLHVAVNTTFMRSLGTTPYKVWHGRDLQALSDDRRTRVAPAARTHLEQGSGTTVAGERNPTQAVREEAQPRQR